MASWFPILLIGLVVVVIIAVAVRSNQRKAERAVALTGYAHARGWRYEARRDGLARRVGLPDSPHGEHVVVGTLDGRPFVAFDHMYETTDSDGDRHSEPQSVVAVNLGVAVPRLELSRQGAVNRFFTGLFGTDHLIGDPAFDDAVRIKTDSPEFTAEVLTPQLRQLVLANLHRDWRFVGDGLVTVARGRHTPDELEAALGASRYVLAQIPPAVWARLRAGASGPAIVDAPVDPAPPPPVAPTAPPSASAQPGGSLEDSIGWSIDPITGKKDQH